MKYLLRPSGVPNFFCRTGNNNVGYADTEEIQRTILVHHQKQQL